MDRESVRNEIIACGRDPVYFINKYVRIRHPKRGLIPFEMFPYQEELARDYQKHRFNIILKARQLGISETTAAYAAWLMMFHRDKNILVMATKADTAKNIIKKINTAIKKLPDWLMLADIITNNKLSIELSNGSQCKAIASSDDAGRSEAVSLLIIDEAAFVPRFDELWTGVLPTVQAGGSVIVLSTPNGVGNKFHTLYIEAERGENDFHPTKLMWWLHPERISDLRDDPDRPGFKTSTWYKNEIRSANMSPRDVAQELECNFNASGETVIQPEQMEQIKEGLIDPMSRENWDRNLWYWWRPREGRKYVVSGDVARGDGKDFSAAIVWDVTDTMEQCAEYYGKVPVEEFAKLLVRLGKEYHNALIVVENNTIGLACLEHIRLAFYENLYYSSKDPHRPGEAVNVLYGSSRSDLVIGFSTTPRTRPLIITKWEEYIRNRQVIYRSKRALEEIRTFIWNLGRAEAMKSYNDDLVMSSAIAIWIRDTFLAPSLMDTEINKKLLNAIRSEKKVNTEIQGASKDPKFVRQANMGVFPVTNPDPFKIRLPGPGNREVDFSWLIDGKISRG